VGEAERDSSSGGGGHADEDRPADAALKKDRHQHEPATARRTRVSPRSPSFSGAPGGRSVPAAETSSAAGGRPVTKLVTMPLS
jgi:hypothetical protein